MRAFLTAATAVLLISNCSKPEESLKSEVEVVRGPLSLQFMASKAVYEYAEPIELELWLTNDSQDTLTISWPYMSGTMFDVQILSGSEEFVWNNDDYKSHFPMGYTGSMYPGNSYYGFFWVPDTLSAGRYRAVGSPMCDREMVAEIGFRVRPEK